MPSYAKCQRWEIVLIAFDGHCLAHWLKNEFLSTFISTCKRINPFWYFPTTKHYVGNYTLNVGSVEVDLIQLIKNKILKQYFNILRYICMHTLYAYFICLKTILWRSVLKKKVIYNIDSVILRSLSISKICKRTMVDKKINDM